MGIKKAISGAKYVEYIAEDRNSTGEWGTMPTTPDFVWVGLVKEFILPYKEIYEETAYLGASTEDHTLDLKRNVSVGTELNATLKYAMQDWTFMQYITGSTSQFSDVVDSISMVAYVDGKWTVLTGGMLTKWSMTIPESGIATVDIDLMFGNVIAPSDSDPSANGHASELGSAPFVWKDVTLLKMDANDPPTTSLSDIVGALSLTITNEVEMPKDVDTGCTTKGGGVALKRRDIEISLDLTYVDLTVFRDLVGNHTKQNLTFRIGNKKITIKGLLFSEWVVKLAPRELIGQTVTAITDLASLTIEDLNILLEGSSTFAGPSGITITHNKYLSNYIPFITPTADADAAVGERYINSIGLNSFTIHNSGHGRSEFRWLIPNAPYDKGDLTFAGPGGQTVTHTKGDTNYVPCIIPSADGNGAIGEWWITDIANTSFVVRNSGGGVTAFKWAIPRFGTGGKGASSFAGSDGVIITHNLNISGGYTPLMIPTEDPNGHLGAVYVTDITTNSFTVKNTGSASTAFTWLICNLP